MCSSCHGLPWLFFLCFWISFPFLPTLITEGDRCQELPQQRQSVHRMPLYTRLSLAHQYLCLPHYSTKMSHSLWGLFAVQTPVLSNDYYLPLFAMAIVFNFIRGAYHTQVTTSEWVSLKGALCRYTVTTWILFPDVENNNWRYSGWVGWSKT